MWWLVVTVWGPRCGYTQRLACKAFRAKSPLRSVTNASLRNCKTHYSTTANPGNASQPVSRRCSTTSTKHSGIRSSEVGPNQSCWPQWQIRLPRPTRSRSCSPSLRAPEDARKLWQPVPTIFPQTWKKRPPQVCKSALATGRPVSWKKRLDHALLPPPTLWPGRSGSTMRSCHAARSKTWPPARP